MKEELLHAIWKLKKFSFDNLKTCDGEKISILNFGQHNFNSGPDFLNAKIKINNTTWIGHVEIHIKASDWNKHKHQTDPAYNNVILHVVYENDSSVNTQSGGTVPTLTLKKRVDPDLLNKYQKLLFNPDWVPCGTKLSKVDPSLVNIGLENLLIERLETKSKLLLSQLETLKNDWEHLCYIMVLKYLGLKVNGFAMQTLSEHLPYFYIKKYHTSTETLEALLLGQAGLLQKPKDDYFKTLKKEFSFMKHKHKLIPMTGVEWRFARMRPSNFPTLRIAQVAKLYSRSPKLFSQIISFSSIRNFEEILNVTASAYWDTHYIPGRPTKFKKKKIGLQAARLLIINAFIPLIFTYGKLIQEESYVRTSLNLYSQLPKEKNVIISNWEKIGICVASAGQSQALIQLKLQYCNLHKCISCKFGSEFIFK